MNNLIQFLTNVGCFKTKHSGRSLGDHLLNTYQILKKANVSEIVCLAGGLHSIYGTNIFTYSTLKYSDRETLTNTFNPRTEYLVYLFSRINRPDGLESGLICDANTKERIYLSDCDLKDLRLMEAANLFEQGSDTSKYPQILKTMYEYLE
jgi:hypothetical protein